MTFKRSVPRTAHRAAMLAAVLASPLAGLGAASATAGTAWAAPTCSGDVSGIQAYAGSNQVAKVGDNFPSPLEAEAVDTGGCPVAGVDIEFVAPATGASGTWPGDAITVSVATASDGIATTPTFTANEVSGSFTVEATVIGGGGATYSTSFQLTNTTIGSASTIDVSSGNDQSARVGDQFASPLEVTVLDSYGDPVDGVTVSFAVQTTAGAGATFVGGGAATTAETGADGVATSPDLTAGDTAGAFTVTATVSGTTASATFSLTDLAGLAYAITAGVGSEQSTELGADFAVPLAVTVTDSSGNDVPGVTVVFRAPSTGASGVFAGSGRTASVVTNSDGIATAPDFSANQLTGGYVVTATAAGLSTPATFGLVNEPRTAASAPGPDGTYWLVTSTGHVLSSGGAPGYGSVPAKELNGVVVGMAALPNYRGYWLVTSKGTVYAFGAAVNYGSPADLRLVAPIVGIAATPDGKGYWLVAADGGLFNYGDAKYYGSPAKLHLAAPIVGIATTPAGKGYWVVASDGGVFGYGDAKYHGSTVPLHLSRAIVGVAATPDGKGYWLLASNGAVYGFGDAVSFSSGELLAPGPVKALVRTADGYGYWVVSADGTAAGFGDAGAQGSPAAKAVVAGAA